MGETVYKEKKRKEPRLRLYADDTVFEEGKELEKDTQSLTASEGHRHVPSPSDSLPPMIYACFLNKDKRHQYKWYEIDPSKSSCRPPYVNSCGLHPRRTRLNACSSVFKHGLTQYFAAASHGSNIYMFGGEDKHTDIPTLIHTDIASLGGTKDVRILKAKPHKAFLTSDKAKCSMLSKRVSSTAVSTSHGIYIFGSEQFGEPDEDVEINPWVEFFDPISHEFSKMPQPPRAIYGNGTFRGQAVVDKETKIILLGRWGLFSFNLKDHTWRKVTTPLVNAPCLGPKTAVLDQILYTFSDGYIRAYDLKRDKWFPEPVQGLQLLREDYPHTYQRFPGYIFYLGRHILCVVWSCPLRSGEKSFLSWMTFQVIMSDDNLKARIKSYSSHNVSGEILDDCFAIQPEG